MKLALAVTSLVLTGCGQVQISGPPELRVGRDECAECGMLIMEDRCSSGTVITENGSDRVVLFDDLGCMFTMLGKPHMVELGCGAAWVHDYPTGTWVRAESATYLFADRKTLRTPMGSGLAAFAAPSAAYEKQDAVGGEVVDYQQARARRAER